MKITESVLRSMIKQVVKEAGYAPYPPPDRYHKRETYDSAIINLAERLGTAIDENDHGEVLEVLQQIINSDTLTNQDLMKMAEATYTILWDKKGSVQTRSDFIKTARDKGYGDPGVFSVDESRKRK